MSQNPNANTKEWMKMEAASKYKTLPGKAKVHTYT